MKVNASTANWSRAFSCHFWSANPDGQPTYVNHRLRDYFGIRSRQDLKPDIAGTVHPDDVAETVKALNHAFQTGESC